MKTFWDWFQIRVLQRTLVLNKRRMIVHHCSCKWIDNMTDCVRITEDEFRNKKYRVAVCCKHIVKL